MENGINILHMDPESYLKVSEERGDSLDTQYFLLAQAIDVLSRLAAQTAQTDTPIVAGIDEIYLRRPVQDETSVGYTTLIEKLADIPGNLYLVFGGEIDEKSDGFFYVRPEIIFNMMLEAMRRRKETHNSTMEELLHFRNQFFLGHVRLGLGSILSGKDKKEVKAAVGYVPVFILPPASGEEEKPGVPKLFLSLPYAMFSKAMS